MRDRKAKSGRGSKVKSSKSAKPSGKGAADKVTPEQDLSGPDSYPIAAAAHASAQAGTAEWFRGMDRRAHRRHDLECRDIVIQRVEGKLAGKLAGKLDEAREKLKPLGQIMDLSAGGLRLRTTDRTARVGSKIRIRIELPAFAGISPFVDHSSNKIRPKREWTGAMTVVRVRDLGNHLEVGARLDELDELDRGMLSLYLSTQPLAA